MTDRETWARARRLRQEEPVRRALLLMVLGLDPATAHSKDELGRARRRRKAALGAGAGEPGVAAAAVDTAYATLTGAPGAGGAVRRER